MPEMINFAVESYTDILVLALPVAIVFEVGNLITSTFLRTAFGGRLWYGK